eukprot:1589234-Heterocapsa_arctica.AAC.1
MLWWDRPARSRAPPAPGRRRIPSPGLGCHRLVGPGQPRCAWQARRLGRGRLEGPAGACGPC